MILHLSTPSRQPASALLAVCLLALPVAALAAAGDPTVHASIGKVMAQVAALRGVVAEELCPRKHPPPRQVRFEIRDLHVAASGQEILRVAGSTSS